MTSSNRRLLFCDVETFSSVDIRSAGAFKYIESDDFEILLLAYAWGDGPVKVIDLTDPFTQDELSDVVEGLLDPGTVKVAHNSAFERAAFRVSLGKYMPPEEWEDTMLLAAYNGLPISLDAVGAALQLQYQKIKEGTTLINYFCKPCKPTISNGGRTRNLREHAPDKWERFKEYCRRDVEVTQAIYYRLHRFPVPDWERRVYALDARINERGVLIDTELAEAAVAIDNAVREENTAELHRITGLDNPNSVAQLKYWLETVGVQCESLNKSTVSDLRGNVTDPTTRRVLELRQLLGKTSTKKYDAMLNVAGKDHRVRGLLQYYGAARTGRWAGRLVQVQNLAQNHLDEISTVRELVRGRDLETLELAFDSVPDVLSQLIRTAFIAKPGHTFLVADYSAIEARVIAYLAGEKWRMDVFANGGDIYCSSASQMFKVPVVKHGVNGHLRQKGKIAELACIAEGQQVLTDQGLVPIERVTTDMKVWDGVEWVSHDGVVYKGKKVVISYDGLEATADHIVWAEIDGELRTVYFGDAASRSAHLLRARADQRPGGGRAEKKELEGNQGMVRQANTYDILNAGPRHRFTVSGVLVHNCGYGGGVGALKAFGADKMGLTEEEMQDIVTQWRQASPTIPKFWRDTENAAKRALENPGRTLTLPCGVEYGRDANALRCKLPSGRVLSYWGARLDDDGSICFMGQNQTTRKWEKTETWGGKLVENIVQAYARDCLAVAMLRLDEAGYKIVFSVHDELIAEAPEGSRWEDMAEIMGRPIDWAPGLLLRADGYSTPYYLKD